MDEKSVRRRHFTIPNIIAAAMGIAGVVFVALMLSSWLAPTEVKAQEIHPEPLLTGEIFDRQGQPISEAEAILYTTDPLKPIAQAATQADGRFEIFFTDSIPDQMTLEVQRTHFET